MLWVVAGTLGLLAVVNGVVSIIRGRSLWWSLAILIGLAVVMGFVLAVERNQPRRRANRDANP